ncbi:MAG: DUF2306 domain-containing protein [Alphaproteobacteria bacterium]|nr:DUF2306 domain-containing protein [Alphaproteobacteria bacterium]
MTPILFIHIAAGALGIVTGAAAIFARKGDRYHRVFGTVFFLSMLVMSAAGVYLALQLTKTSVVPPGPTAIVGAFTFYLVTTAWITVRHKPGEIGISERAGFVVACVATAAMLTLGLAVALGPVAPPPPGLAPYFAFATLAALAAAGDLNLIRKGGLRGASRVSRHLWRMCLALFFATSFFFIGQQKVMPAYMHGSPILLVLGLAPLAILLFWAVAVRFRKQFRSEP